MNAAKYFSFKYWARKYFALRPIGGAPPEADEHNGEFVRAEVLGLFILSEIRGIKVSAQSRGIFAYRQIRAPRKPGPETRSPYPIHKQPRGITV